MYTREEFIAQYVVPAPSPQTEVCPICHEAYNTTDHAPVTFSDEKSCKHVFGRSCLETWLNMAHVTTCPFCRRKLYEDSDAYSEVDSLFDSDPFDNSQPPNPPGVIAGFMVFHGVFTDATDVPFQPAFVQPPYDSVGLYFFGDEEEREDEEEARGFDFGPGDPGWSAADEPFVDLRDEELIAILKLVWDEIELGIESFHLDWLFEPPPEGATRHHYVRRMFLDMLPDGTDEDLIGLMHKEALNFALRGMVDARQAGIERFEDAGEEIVEMWLAWIKRGLNINF